MLLPAQFEKLMPEIIENALIMQNDDEIFPKDFTRHQYVFDSKKPSSKRKVGEYGEAMGKSSGSDGEAMGKTDTDSDTDSESDTDTDTDTE